jgi:hypothetical protein
METTINKGARTWSYNGRPSKGGGYAIRSGDEIIGRVKNVGDAELICRAERMAVRSAMLRAADARQHRVRVDALKKDIRTLLLSLDLVAKVLKRGSRPREITAAREKVHKIMKEMKARGHCT